MTQDFVLSKCTEPPAKMGEKGEGDVSRELKEEVWAGGMMRTVYCFGHVILEVLYHTV